VKVDYWKTGHSYIKRRVNELSAIAGLKNPGTSFSTNRSAAATMTA
jgi:phosphomannomutase/phosphoglucomutase